VNAYLEEKGIGLRAGTLVDATIIPAPSSTKNKAGARDPDMSSTKKGKKWHFGIKAHVGVDAVGGIVHRLEVTTAKPHDSRVRHELLHGNETSARSDKAHGHSEQEVAFTGVGGFRGVMRKAPEGGELDPNDAQVDRIIAMVRAKAEHPFRVIERQFGHAKTRYRGHAGNWAHLFTLFALGTPFLVRRQLLS